MPTDRSEGAVNVAEQADDDLRLKRCAELTAGFLGIIAELDGRYVAINVLDALVCTMARVTADHVERADQAEFTKRLMVVFERAVNGYRMVNAEPMGRA